MPSYRCARATEAAVCSCRAAALLCCGAFTHIRMRASLQVKIVRLLRHLGRGSPEASDAMSDVLAQVRGGGGGGGGGAGLRLPWQVVPSAKSSKGDGRTHASSSSE